MELVDLYDENRIPLGRTAERHGPKEPGACRTASLRACIHSRMMQAGQGFFCPTRRKTAGILGVLQGFLTQQDRKRPGLTVSDGCEYRFYDGPENEKEL